MGFRAPIQKSKGLHFTGKETVHSNFLKNRPGKFSGHSRKNGPEIGENSGFRPRAPLLKGGLERVFTGEKNPQNPPRPLSREGDLGRSNGENFSLDIGVSKKRCCGVIKNNYIFWREPPLKKERDLLFRKKPGGGKRTGPSFLNSPKRGFNRPHRRGGSKRGPLQKENPLSEVKVASLPPLFFLYK